MQTLPTVPLPAKKSNTVAPGYDSAFINRSIIATGFWVGWPTRSLLFNLPISHTLVGFFPFLVVSGFNLLSLNATFKSSSEYGTLTESKSK